MTMIDDQSTIPMLDTNGYAAHVDAFAWEQDFSGKYYARKYNLWFLSLVGVTVNVNAIWARLLKGELATLTMPDGKRTGCTLAPEPPKSWKRYTSALRNAAGYNLALLPEAIRFDSTRSDFVILPKTEEEAPALHYRYLDRRLPVPLHPQWESWLWDRAVRTSEAVVLETHGCLAYRCVPNINALKADLAGAIRTGVIGVSDVQAAA